MFEANWEKRKLNFGRRTSFIWHKFIEDIDDNLPVYRSFNLDCYSINVYYVILSFTFSQIQLDYVMC